MLFTFVLGTRPEFIKLYSVIQTCLKNQLPIQIIHSGQHYDFNLSDVFINELSLPVPDYYLKVGSGSHGEQTAELLRRLEAVLIASSPSAVLAVGDTNTVLAAALVSSKLGIPFVHVEAGVRSYDMSMPEEINRRVADSIATVCLAPTKRASLQLIKEGRGSCTVMVGDTLVEASLPLSRIAVEHSKILDKLSLQPATYAVMTLHRSENVDKVERLNQVAAALEQLSFPIIYPIHPRSRKMLEKFELLPRFEKCVRVIDPLGYQDFLALQAQSKLIMTDSGGVQQEASILNIPCLTLRYNTEWVETVELGKNFLVGAETSQIVSMALKIWNDDKFYHQMQSSPSPFVEGAAKKIVDILKENPGNILSIPKSNFLRNGISNLENIF